MSHLIAGLGVSAQPVLDRSPVWDVVAPKFKNILRSTNHSSQFNAPTWKQQAAISNLCKKLSEQEYEMLRCKNAKQIEYHFSKLKSRLHRHLSSNSPSVSRFFESHPEHNSINMKYFLQKMPLKVNLDRKYNSKLVHFVETVKDAQNISKQKQSYHRWLDNRNNSPIKSPNYCKMNFVLQRLSDENKVLEDGKVGSKSNRKIRVSQEVPGILVRRPHYISKDRRIRTQGSQNVFR